MNLVQANLLREVAAEVKAKGGPVQFKAHALKNLELRTVLKESHCSPILDLVFNSLASEHRNLFASVGKDQATIYDDEHMGDFLGVVVHYVNGPSAHHKGGDLTCCAWVQMAGLTRHELGDTCLAVSGPEGVIQVMSVVEARVVAMLQGHRGEVVELRGCAGVPGLLLSLGADGGVRLWDVTRGTCLGEVTSDATTMEVHPDGSCFFTGHRGGRLCSWRLDLELDPATDQGQRQDQRQAGDGARACSAPLAANNTRPNPLPSREPSFEPAPSHTPPQPPATGVMDGRAAAPSSTAPGPPSDPCGELPTAAASAASPSEPSPLRLRRSQHQALALRAGRLPVSEPLQLPGTALGDYVDCLRCMAAAPEAGEGPGPAGSRGLLAAKSSDGRLGVWDLDRGQQLLSLRVPGTHPPGGAGGPGGAAARGTRCRFSVTRDGAFICVGNVSGDVYVYDTSSGARAAHYSASKMRGPARAAALSEDGRHLLAVHGNGYILRYEYIRKQGKEGKKGVNVDEEAAAAAGVAADEATADGGGGGGCGGTVAVDGPTSSREVSPDPPCSHADEDDVSVLPPPPPAGLAGLPPKRPRASPCPGGMDGGDSDEASDGRRVRKRADGSGGGGGAAGCE